MNAKISLKRERSALGEGYYTLQFSALARRDWMPSLEKMPAGPGRSYEPGLKGIASGRLACSRTDIEFQCRGAEGIKKGGKTLEC